MINNTKPITLVELKDLLKDIDTDKSKALKDFVKKFIKIDHKTSHKLLGDLDKLEILKLKELDIVKIIDFIPSDADDVRRIFIASDISLDQNEIEKILNVTNTKK